MSKKIKDQLIPLSIGVSIFCFLLALSIFAWTEPSIDPPNDNIQAPVTVGSTAQTKSGALTVTELTTSEARLYLDDSSEGDIYRVDQIIGYNDLRLYRDSATCPNEVADADLWIDGSGNVNVLNGSFIVGDSGTPACLKLRDSDNGGWTYCVVLNGSMSCSTTPCD